MRRWWRKRRRETEIHPDEILLDSSNLPEFDRNQFEGRIERPLGARTSIAAGALLTCMFTVFLAQAAHLQLFKGSAYAAQARENQLAQQVVFADRGQLLDRTGRPVAWSERRVVEADFADRVYATYRGMAHVVGYVQNPAKDSSGFYFRESHEGVAGAERVFDERLSGENGLRLIETNAVGNTVSQAVVRPPQAGEQIRLSVDAAVTEALYDAIVGRAQPANAQGGAGVIMDVRTGELLALTSYPEYSSAAMTAGDREALAAYNVDKRLPFLDRAVDGLYAPGSIVKPVLAAAAVAEGIISEHKEILSTGSITIPNPYDETRPTVFRDWRVNGWTDAREAVAVSSDVYFYAIGGGYKDQLGLGIRKIDEYYRMFGFGADAGLPGFSSKAGNIPTPEWKAEVFPDDPVWRLGNTYHTAIGQYGVTVTPLQAARMTVAVANGGMLLTPSLLLGTAPEGPRVALGEQYLRIGQEGMRLSVTGGTAGAVNLPFVSVAAKTGTAEVGARKEYQNSWMIGYWPYENPRYAYAVVLERVPAGTMIGGSAIMYDFFTWLHQHAPEYLE